MANVKSADARHSIFNFPLSLVLLGGLMYALIEVKNYSEGYKVDTLHELSEWFKSELPEVSLPAFNLAQYIEHSVAEGFSPIPDHPPERSVTELAQIFKTMRIDLTPADIQKVIEHGGYTIDNRSFEIYINSTGEIRTISVPYNPELPILDPKTDTITFPAPQEVAPPTPAPVKPVQTVVERPVAPAPESDPDTQSAAELAHLNLSQIAHPSEVSTRPPTPEEVESFQKNALHMYKLELSEEEARAALESGTLERDGQHYTVWENNKSPEFYLAPSMTRS
jgi:hypothetical protein